MEKSILVSGCSSGIGLCLARGLQKNGYYVIATARREEDVRLLQAEGFHALQLDLDDSNSIQQVALHIAQDSQHQFYGVINNGAYGQVGAVEDLSRDMLRAQFETNVFGTQELTNALIPLLRSHGEGRVIYISSVLGLVCMPMRGAYSASKFALEALADNLRLESADSGVQVALVEPGPIASKFRENALNVFNASIDVERSPHAERYKREIQRLENQGHNSKFTLQPEAVLEKVQHALNSPRARARYYVTTPTWLFGLLRRILPTRALDALLIRA